MSGTRRAGKGGLFPLALLDDLAEESAVVGRKERAAGELVLLHAHELPHDGAARRSELGEQ